MLQLRNVGLDYLDGGDTVHALRRINLTLSGTGLVLISGPTGSGKSTMLRVLAGREDPSRGEIALDGENTARWNETRRSAWRRRVGDASEELLLPDRTAAENAALSARMAGWRGADARRQASDALAALGLSDRSRALPGEMTARERKLTAIGCALARDPEILLLDEPFEGLDAITVQQVRELLTERASVRMVVAFSRDPMLFDGAEDTAAELEEGEIVSLRNEPEAGPPVPAPAPASAGPAMALASLFRPRGKAAVRLFGMFASVLAVCLGLACLQGAQRRASALQAETLAAYPLVLGKDSVTSGDLESLAAFLDREIDPHGAQIQRSRALTPQIYSLGADGRIRQVTPDEENGTALWTELPRGEELQHTGYDLVSGRWPNRYDEAAVLLDSQGSLDRACMQALGLSSEEAAAGLNYMDLLRLSFRVVLPTGEYVQNVDGTWGYLGGDESFLNDMVRNSLPLKIVGILRPVQTGAADVRIGGVLYMSELTDWVTESINTSRIVTEQRSDPSRDVLTGLPFNDGTLDSDLAAKRQLLKSRVSASSGAYQVQLYQRLTDDKVDETAAEELLLQLLDGMEEEKVTELFDQEIGRYISAGSLEDNLRSFGVLDAGELAGLRIYALSFAYRGKLASILNRYEQRVSYTDPAAAVISAGASMLESQGTVFPVLRWVLLCLGALGVILASALPLLTRKRETAVLRALGLPGDRAAGALVWEALLLGLLGSAAGTLGALLIQSFVSAFREGLPWSTALLIGAGAAILGAVSARIAAGDTSRRSPAEALRRAEE